MEGRPPSAPPQAVMMQMITGYWVSKSLYVAARLGIADRVEEKALSAEELAQETGADSASLYRVLRALASVGVFAEDAGGRFGLTPLAECLLSGRPGSMHAMALMAGGETFAAWTEFQGSIQTGEPAWDRVFERPIWEYFGAHPDAAAVFQAAMTGMSQATDEAVAAAYDFSQLKRVIDVAGGRGTQLAAILRRNPHLRGVLFDLPPVIAAGGPLADDAELAARADFVGGSFFDGLPPDVDACVLKHVLHDWDDADAARILAACRRSLSDGGRVLAVDAVIQPGNDPDWSKLLDLQMLVIGGRERTERQYRNLFETAGFRLTRVFPVAAPTHLSVVEGLKQP